jgi:hypothetical protein
VLTVPQAKTRELKQNLNNEFRSIHELCMYVLANTRKVELLRATLTALAAYLSWIPPGWYCIRVGVLVVLTPQLQRYAAGAYLHTHMLSGRSQGASEGSAVHAWSLRKVWMFLALSAGEQLVIVHCICCCPAQATSLRARW